MKVQGIDDTRNPEIIGDIASGVDTTSRTANEQSGGYTPHSWIMTPVGGAGNRVEMTLGTSASMNMTLSADKGFPNPSLLTQSPKIVNWFGEGIKGSEHVIKASIEGSDEIVLPIWAKNMQARNLRVTVHPITLIKPDGTKDEPDFIPTKTELEDYLNRVFREQINTTCSVNLKNVREVAWDASQGTNDLTQVPNTDYPLAFLEPSFPMPNDGILDLNQSGTYHEPKLITETDNTGNPGSNENTGHIQVYLVGGSTAIRTLLISGNPNNPNDDNVYFRSSGFAKGIAFTGHTNPRRCWIADSALQDPEAGMHTIAHEIGHFIVGSGHPDEPAIQDQGPAPLQGTGLSHRLMVSGRSESRKSRLGLQLVKAEWDAAERNLDIILNN